MTSPFVLTVLCDKPVLRLGVPRSAALVVSCDRSTGPPVRLVHDAPAGRAWSSRARPAGSTAPDTASSLHELLAGASRCLARAGSPVRRADALAGVASPSAQQGLLVIEQKKARRTYGGPPSFGRYLAVRVSRSQRSQCERGSLPPLTLVAQIFRPSERTYSEQHPAR